MQTAIPAAQYGDLRPSAEVITVASAPAGHPYIARVSAAEGVTVLPDPVVPGAPDGVWWPPQVLDPAWIERNRSAAQLLHIHFGTESFSPAHLESTLAAARRVGWPVVFTVHDLEHPQLGDQTEYSAQLEVLVRGADAVMTLTEGAASAIARRWDRRALVVPHPSVLAPDAALPGPRPSEDVLIGVHLKDLRPNVDGPGSARMILEASARLRAMGMPVSTEIRLHHRVRDESARDDVRRLCAADEHAILVEHDRLSDAELTVALSRLDAYVLPYRHGTHSGWLELCWDLGVPVAAPAVGFYAEQHADGSVASYRPADPAALTEALVALLSESSATRAGTPDRIALCDLRRSARRAADASAAAAHAAVYHLLLQGTSE